MLQTLTIAVRTLLKRPGYSLSIVLTLALGIGASTMMFSLVDAALLRPLPFDRSDRLVLLIGVAGPQRAVRGGSFPEIADWRTMNATLHDVAIYDETSVNLRVGTEVIRAETEMVSASYFSLLGATAALGRTFLAEEDAVVDRHPVAVISGRLWQERFGRDPAVLQRTVQLNDRAFQIVGVMPDGFAGISFDTDIWVPSMMVSLTSAPTIVENRGTRWLMALARLNEGVTVERAQEDLTRVAGVLEQQHPDTNRERGVQVTVLQDSLLGNTASLVLALFSAVVLFLTVACANVAGLQLARATARRREMALRLALGAGRWHVLRQLLTESLVLSVAAGTLGVIAAAWSIAGIAALLPNGALPRYVQPGIDPRTLAFTIFVSLLAGTLVAILPVMASSRHDLLGWLKEGARSAGPGLGSIRRPSAQQALVVAEIALAMTLLTVAGLMLRSLDRQMNVRLGFEPRGVTVARLTLPGNRYTPPQRVTLVDQLEARLHAIPGVRSVTIASTLPFTGGSSAATLLPDAAPSGETGLRYFRHFVTPGFFETLGIALRRGRAFSAQDRLDSPLVAIINVSAARRIWGTDEVIGRRFHMGTIDGPLVEVVGVAADARFLDLTTDLQGARVEPDVYFPYAQRTDRDIELAVRSADGAPVPLVSLQAAVSGIDPGLPLYRVQGLDEAVQAQTSTARFGSTMLMTFSAGALLLAAVGLYGLIAYVVGLSRREIAIRLALGADGRRLVGLIVRNAMVLVIAGTILGGIAAAAAGRALSSQLFETGALEPATFAVVATLLLAVTFMASLLPTRRAVGVDPQTALRAD